jgi:hypothetical protein
MKDVKQIKAKAEADIKDLAGRFEDGKLTLGTREFKLLHAGRSFLRVAGPRGTVYNIVPCPQCTVIEDNSLPVYSFTRLSRSFDFTFDRDGQYIELSGNA